MCLNEVGYLDNTSNAFPFFIWYDLCDVSGPPYSTVRSGSPSCQEQKLSLLD